MNAKEKITVILKDYTKKHNISASVVILEEYAEELIRQGIVVPIRCKDCTYYQKMETDGLCMCGDKKTSYAADFYPKENDFCSYGERKDGE